MDMGQVITIDGPAASGKTSVSRELAKRMGWHWVSTGAFYRGLAYAAMRLSMDLTNEQQLAELSMGNKWRVEMDEERTRVYFENEDITDQIAQEAVGNVASKISHFPKVRESLLQGQRRCQAMTSGLIAEGRDCGTVVFPEAEIKIYLTARSENRAERRAKEQGLSAESLIEAQTQRDLQDSTRKAAPLQVPPNALLVDTTELDFDQVVSLVEKHVKNSVSKSSH
jgi:cytidylate kinase